MKFILRCFFGLIALLFLLGALIEGKEFMCFPAGFLVAGLLTAATAKRKALDGSMLRWGLYGALVPVISWVEIAIAGSQNKVKGFLKGMAYSFGGLVIFLAVFSTFLPPAPHKEPLAEKIHAEVLVPTSDDKVTASVPTTPSPQNVVDVKPVPATTNIVPVVSQKVKPKPEVTVRKEPERETFPVYLGERRVLIDPDDDDDEEQVSRPARKNVSGSGNVVITPKGKKYHYASCRTVRGSYTRLTVAQARKRGYKPCKVCSPPSR